MRQKTNRPAGGSGKDKDEMDRHISDAYPEIDNDLARDNLENDLPAAELEDM
ncbi:MAG: hypothetical protein ACI3VB_05890 [Oscillospiraceae bacterium]